ncbi:hypothetical protein RND81_07G050200 [Saponaria officinalis]|uniref:RING-type domain-containing protein n=1 Tax=Saponaria officinalis TaxID=3572 RepID=A0AAW1JMK6_SAPOF
MPSASVFFYGRRSRSSRTFDDSISSPPSPSVSNPSSHAHPRRRSIADLHHRHRRHSFAVVDDADHTPPPSYLPRPSFLSPPVQENELHQRGNSGESSSGDLNNREIVCDLSRRFSRNNRLPGPVLLAKERLLQRLRSVSVSGARQRRETPPSFHCNDFWVIDADWETSGFREPETANSSWSEYPAEAHESSTSEEPKKKPLGLSNETLSKLHREVFIENPNASIHLISEAECSICLENFVEGNDLVSLPCGHRFHTLCLSPWLKTCGECPYCRSCIMLGS